MTTDRTQNQHHAEPEDVSLNGDGDMNEEIDESSEVGASEVVRRINLLGKLIIPPPAS